MTKYPTDEELAAAVEKITAAVREVIADFKAAAPSLVQSLSDDEWTKLKADEDRRRAERVAEREDLHEVAARLPALTKIAGDLEYRLPGSGRPLANIALTRQQCIDLLARLTAKGDVP